MKNQFTEGLEKKLKDRNVEVLTASSLLRIIKDCPITLNLYNEAIAGFKEVGQPQLSIRFIGKKQLRFDGECAYMNGEILIKANLSKNRALLTLVFELLNATRAKQFKDIGHDQWVKDPDLFAIQHEKIEYENTKRHRTIILDACKEHGWDPDLTFGAHTFWNFEIYLILQKLSGHYQYYIRKKEWKEYQISLKKYNEDMKKYDEDMKKYNEDLEKRIATNEKFVEELREELKKSLIESRDELVRLKEQPGHEKEIADLELIIKMTEESLAL